MFFPLGKMKTFEIIDSHTNGLKKIPNVGKREKYAQREREL